MSEATQTAEDIEKAQKARERELRAECGRLGLTNVPKKASIETLEGIIQRHLDAKAQADAILAEQKKITDATPVDEVKCRVTKLGGGKLSKGVHVPGKGDLRHSWKDDVMIDRTRAKELEDIGYVEIEDGADAAA